MPCYTSVHLHPLRPYAAVLGFFVPYFDLDVIRLPTPPCNLLAFCPNPTLQTSPTRSSAPRTKWYFTPGQSCALPPLTITTLCCCTLCPSPGIYAVITLPVLNRTLAIFRSPEFGFLGFVVPTLRHTPLSSGLFFSCGERSFRALCWPRPPRRTWINVHLCAIEEGCGRAATNCEACWKAGDVSAVRRGANGDWVRTEGRMRRRRNVTGMVMVGAEVWAGKVCLVCDDGLEAVDD